MTIEERIVQLGLDNKNFERHAAESLKTLDSLDKTLQSFGNVIGLDKVGDMIDTVTHRFSALGIAGDQVIRKLTDSVMGLVGQMGNLAKSMSVDQIGEGFSKYGEKTQAVQTIMAATAKDIGTKFADQGEQMEYVNQQLEKLNWFTDETSYSFLDMVNNIGKFTSNGVGLEESVTAMEGISTWAAISGANVGEASRAMYNLAQALATGSVKLIDWKSIENANMATLEFKETALETAVALGTLKKNADGSYTVMKDQAEEAGEAADKAKKKAEKAAKTFTAEQFNTQLSTGWFSKEVLMETLQTYGRFTDVLNKASEASGETASRILHEIDVYKNGGKVAAWLVPYIKDLASAENDLGYRAFKAAQEAKTFEDAIKATKDAVSTGWMNLWEKVFGNYLEAKKLWTDMAESFYNIFAEPINKLNDIFKIAFREETTKKETSGWSKLEKKVEESGHSMEDFEKAYKKVIKSAKDPSLEGLIDEYGTLEEAFKSGRISAELFNQILQELTGQTSETAGDVEVNTENMNKSLEDMRKVALEVLRGDYGNGQDRIDWLKEHGYDPEIIQAMAGNLKNFHDQFGSYDMSDDQLIAAMEAYYQFNDLSERLGADSFAAFLSAAGYTEEEIQAMNEMLEQSEELYNGVSSSAEDAAEETQNGTELFAEGLTNLLHVFEGVYTAADEAFDAVFGTVDQLGTALGDSIKKFHSFSESIQIMNSETGELNEKGERLKNVFIGVMSVAKTVGKAIGTAFRAAGKAIGLVMRLAGSVLNLMGQFYMRFKSIGVFRHFGDAFKNIFEGIRVPLEHVVKLLRIQFSLFKSRDGEKLFNKISRAVYSFSRRVLEASQKFKNFMTSYETIAKINNIFYKLVDFVKKAVGALVSFKDLVVSVFGIVGTVFSGAIEKITGFGDSIVKLKEGETILSKIINWASKAANWISKAFTTVKDAIQGAFGGDNGVGVMNILKSLLKLFIGFKVAKGVGGILGKLGDLFGGIGSIGEFLKNPASIFLNFAEGLKEMFGITKEEGSFAKDLRNIAISIGILALSLKLLAGIPEDQIAGAMGHLTTVLVEMVGALKLISEFGGGGKKMAFASAALIAIGLAMLMLAASMKIISKIDPERLTASWEAMSLSLLALVATLMLVSQMKLNPKRVLAAGLAVIGLALAMLVLSASLFILSKIPAEDLTKAWEAMALSLLAMVGALTLLNKVGAGKMLAAGAALVGVAAAMLIMAVALGILGKVIDGNEDVIIGFIGVLAVMTIALVALSMLGPVVLAAGAALLLAGAGFAIGAIGLIILAKALQMFSDVNVKPDYLLMLGGALIGLGVAGVIFGVGGLGLLIGGAGLLVLAYALKAFNDVTVKADYLLSFGGALMALGIAGVIFGLGGLGLLIGSAGLAALGYALKAFDGVEIAPDYLLGLAGALLALGLAGVILMVGSVGLGIAGPVLKELGEALPTFAEGVKAFGDVSGESLKATFIALAEAVTALFVLQFTTIHDGVPVLKELGEAMPGLVRGFKAFEEIDGDTVSKAGEGLGKAINAMFTLQFASFRDGSEPLNNLANVLPNLATAFKSFSELEPTAIQNMGTALRRAINSLFQLQFTTISDGTPQLITLSESLPKIAAGFKAFEGLDADWLKTMTKSISDAISDLTSGGFLGLFTGKNNFSGIVELGDALVKLHDGLASFEGMNVESPVASVVTLMDNMRASIRDYLPNFETSGSDIPVSISTGLDNNVTGADAGMQHVMNSISNMISSFESTWNTLGGNIAIGIANGIINKTNEAVSAIHSLASSIQTTFSVSLAIRSPSRVMEGLAEYIPLGIAKGIKNESGAVEEEMITVISPILAALNQLMESDDFSISPTITPVVDMSNARMAAGSMNSMFGSGYRSYVDGITARAGDVNQSIDYNLQNKEVVSEVRSLSSRLDLLGDKIANMQIVLDSGLMVGAMAPQMDSRLGQIAVRKGRGN